VTRRNWSKIIAQAVSIAAELTAEVSIPPTLRQLHYRLVSLPELGYPNEQGAYKRLSELSARDRRKGTFPELTDLTRSVELARSWAGPRQAVADLASRYRRDRTEGQDVLPVLGVEKATLAAQLRSWLGDPYGLPLIVLRGYGSQTYADDVRRLVESDGRPAVLLYAGDHDPSGDDILRDFTERSDCWAKIVRVAVTAEQVDTYGLPIAPGKTTDSRAGRFIAEHGELRQVETEALPPSVLRDLFTDALEPFWDVSRYEEVIEREAADRSALRSIRV